MPYNKGDDYEEYIFNILKSKKLIPNNFVRAGAGEGTDIRFLHKSEQHNLEVKLDLKADYGQKMLKWDTNNKWQWSVNDYVTQLYTSLGILNYVNSKNFIPNRFTIPKDKITLQDKKQDQQAFEDKHNLDIKALHGFYSSKDCYYIQVGGCGFYHLEKDILNLGTQQFNSSIYLRLRAKTIRSKPIHNYGFYAVIKIKGIPQISIYDVEEKNGRLFPLII